MVHIAVLVHLQSRQGLIKMLHLQLECKQHCWRDHAQPVSSATSQLSAGWGL